MCIRDSFKAIGSKEKELVIVPEANHVDLYDNVAGKIPFAKFEQFFKDVYKRQGLKRATQGKRTFFCGGTILCIHNPDTLSGGCRCV